MFHFAFHFSSIWLFLLFRFGMFGVSMLYRLLSVCTSNTISPTTSHFFTIPSSFSRQLCSRHSISIDLLTIIAIILADLQLNFLNNNKKETERHIQNATCRINIKIGVVQLIFNYNQMKHTHNRTEFKWFFGFMHRNYVNQSSTTNTVEL